MTLTPAVGNNQRFPKRITISVAEDVRDDLNFITDSLNINRSSLLRQLILDWMISHKEVFQDNISAPSSDQMQNAIKAND